METDMGKYVKADPPAKFLLWACLALVALSLYSALTN